MMNIYNFIDLYNINDFIKQVLIQLSKKKKKNQLCDFYSQ